MRPEERSAQRILSANLGREVVCHDDGSQNGMYDLRVGPPDCPELAVEVVGAVDRVATETWNVGPAKGPLCVPSKSDWIVSLVPHAHIKSVKQDIGRVLLLLEARDIGNLFVDHRLERTDPSLFRDLSSLGIADAYRYRVDGTGTVHLTMGGTGGVVDEHGESIPEWIASFLCDVAQRDVLSKLDRSGAASRHVFVFVAMNGAPFPVESYLKMGPVHIPSTAPDLPPPITGVWIIADGQTRGPRWDGTAWGLFQGMSREFDD